MNDTVSEDGPNYPRIWLQPFAGEEGSHTWCQDRQSDEDIEYVRADIAYLAATKPPLADVTDDRLWELLGLIPKYQDGTAREGWTGRISGTEAASIIAELLARRASPPMPGRGEGFGPESEARIKRDGPFIEVDWWRYGLHLRARVYEPQMMPLSDSLADVLATSLEMRPELAEPTASRPKEDTHAE